jgi:hypothetical protein
LEEAQRTLAIRKSYDELAEKITSNRLLRPREDQNANLEKLNVEIAELEKESKEYAQTWAERREQFGKIVEEGMQLRRLIRDEKEEVERREGMEREDGEDGEGGTQRGDASNAGTPRPDAGGATPLHTGSQDETPPAMSSGLSVPKDRLPPRSTPSRSGSRAPSPTQPESVKFSQEGDDDDETMTDQGTIEEGETEDLAMTEHVDSSGEKGLDEREEGEEDEDDEPESGGRH